MSSCENKAHSLPGSNGSKLSLETSLCGRLIVLTPLPTMPVSVSATPTSCTHAPSDPAHIVWVGQVLAGTQLIKAAMGGALRKGRVREESDEQEEGQGQEAGQAGRCLP